jgi:hypothetical protein
MKKPPPSYVSYSIILTTPHSMVDTTPTLEIDPPSTRIQQPERLNSSFAPASPFRSSPPSSPCFARPWLDNYTSVNTRSSAIEQSQIRQRRFNDLIALGVQGNNGGSHGICCRFAVLLFAVGPMSVNSRVLTMASEASSSAVAWAGFLFYLCHRICRAAVSCKLSISNVRILVPFATSPTSSVS